MLRSARRYLAAAFAALLIVDCSGGALSLPASEPVSALPESLAPAPADAPAACEQALKDERWPAATTACERARSAAPGDAAAAARLSKAYLGRGRAVLGQGDVEEALKWFERARDAQPDSREAAREYALALAYRGGELALAAGDRVEALAKFQAVYDGDRLYLAWLPERAARRRIADIEAAWGQELLADGAWGDAEAHCRAALALVADLEPATDCIATIFRARTPTPTPTPTPAPTRIPVRVLPIVPSRPVVPPLPPRPAAPPTPAPAPPTRVAPAIPTLGTFVGPR